MSNDPFGNSPSGGGQSGSGGPPGNGGQLGNGGQMGGGPPFQPPGSGQPSPYNTGPSSPNPYQIPQQPSSFQPPPPSNQNPVLVPGIIMAVFSTLWLLYGILNVAVLAAQGFQPPPPPQDAAPGAEVGMAIGYYAAAFGIPIGGLIGVMGSVALIVRKSYPIAMAGTIVNLIPCCSGCGILNIPFAIWALVLLMKPEVKAMFSQQR